MLSIFMQLFLSSVSLLPMLSRSVQNPHSISFQVCFHEMPILESALWGSNILLPGMILTNERLPVKYSGVFVVQSVFLAALFHVSTNTPHNATMPGVDYVSLSPKLVCCGIWRTWMRVQADTMMVINAFGSHAHWLRNVQQASKTINSTQRMRCLQKARSIAHSREYNTFHDSRKHQNCVFGSSCWYWPCYACNVAFLRKDLNLLVRGEFPTMFEPNLVSYRFDAGYLALRCLKPLKGCSHCSHTTLQPHPYLHNALAGWLVYWFKYDLCRSLKCHKHTFHQQWPGANYCHGRFVSSAHPLRSRT